MLHSPRDVGVGLRLSRRSFVPAMNKFAQFSNGAGVDLTAPQWWFDAAARQRPRSERRKLLDTEVDGAIAYTPQRSLDHMALVHVSVSFDTQHFHSVPRPILMRHRAVLRGVFPKFVCVCASCVVGRL